VPWQRVVNHFGRISSTNRELSAQRQADILRAEGVFVDDEMRLQDFARHLWEGLSLFEIDDILNGT
jgi:alkylated DNA nucleotide flippase Atl1